MQHVRQGTVDLALLTDDVSAEIVRREPLLWVTSANHATHERDPIPMAVGRPTCTWRRHAYEALDAMGREYRTLFTSYSVTVITAAVLSGTAVAVLPECALRPGMRVLGERDGFQPLPDCCIGLVRGHNGDAEIVEALVRHVVECLDNISAPTALNGDGSPFDFETLSHRHRNGKRLRPAHLLPGW